MSEREREREREIRDKQTNLLSVVFAQQLGKDPDLGALLLTPLSPFAHPDFEFEFRRVRLARDSHFFFQTEDKIG